MCGILTKGCIIIRSGNTFSTSFCVSNGEKQGGIVSPVLFNVDMDDFSCVLNRSNIRGRIGAAIVNHLCYADDLCLICLSSAGMQKLLNVRSKYALSIACHLMQTSHILRGLKLPQ